MNLIIIEGTDNIGKDTIINNIVQMFDTVTLIHCSGPKSKIFPSQEQDNKFMSYAKNIKDNKYDSTDCIIMNRSHLGEYVYGQIYRDRKKSNILYMIDKVNYMLKYRDDLKIKYIQLLSLSNDLRKKYDDNKSLSKMDDELMSKENELFLQIYTLSSFDKKLIYVNENDNFRPKEDIMKEILYFLNN